MRTAPVVVAKILFKFFSILSLTACLLALGAVLVKTVLPLLVAGKYDELVRLLTDPIETYGIWGVILKFLVSV